MPTYANEFDYLEAEVHQIMAGTDLVRQETYAPAATPPKHWYFLDMGEIHSTDESEGGARTSWKIDMVILVGIVGRTGNASVNALRSASNAIVAELMRRFDAARHTERVFRSTGDDRYEVRVQDLKIIAPVGVIPDTSTQGWAVVNGELHYDRSKLRSV